MDLQEILRKLTAEEQNFISTLIDKDPLTGVYNRRKLNQDIHLLASISERRTKGCGLLIIDIDHFKKINDLVGHLEGDRILKEVVKCLKRILRSYDEMYIYRYGGDEFVVIIPDTTLHNTLIVSERIRIQIKKSCNVSVSIGVSHHKEITPNIDELLSNADKALRRVKRLGRDKVLAYNLVGMNSSELSMLRRSGHDRRAARNRRQVYDLEYFLNGGVERRMGQKRRSPVERRNGWRRIEREWSLPIESNLGA